MYSVVSIHCTPALDDKQPGPQHDGSLGSRLRSHFSPSKKRKVQNNGRPPARWVTLYHLLIFTLPGASLDKRIARCHRTLGRRGGEAPSVLEAWRWRTPSRSLRSVCLNKPLYWLDRAPVEKLRLRRFIFSSRHLRQLCNDIWRGSQQFSAGSFCIAHHLKKSCIIFSSHKNVITRRKLAAFSLSSGPKICLSFGVVWHSSSQMFMSQR